MRLTVPNALCQEVSCRPKATNKPKTHTNDAGQTAFWWTVLDSNQ